MKFTTREMLLAMAIVCCSLGGFLSGRNSGRHLGWHEYSKAIDVEGMKPDLARIFFTSHIQTWITYCPFCKAGNNPVESGPRNPHGMSTPFNLHCKKCDRRFNCQSDDNGETHYFTLLPKYVTTWPDTYRDDTTIHLRYPRHENGKLCWDMPVEIP